LLLVINVYDVWDSSVLQPRGGGGYWVLGIGSLGLASGVCFCGSGFDIDLWQAAVVAFLMHFNDWQAHEAIAKVRKHRIADPMALRDANGWFEGVVLM
jgi:hypothetical protein